MEKLRFAPIIRVSTERQEQIGESLNTQTTQIMQFVEILNGVIPEECWKYKGQEHATPGHERAKIDQLLEDTSKGIFDAVIVVDPSRWSRDNLRNEIGLQILLDSGIRFFVGTREYDLANSNDRLFLAMNAVMNQYQANIHSEKSIVNRIERAKKNLPSAGPLPYGRTFDPKAEKTEKWGVDPVKKKLIEQAAKRYIGAKKGEGIPTIAKTVGVSPAHLWRILTKWGGEEYPVTFKNKAKRTTETIILHIPRLLDEETIKQIHEKTRLNINYERGNKKYPHLLQGMVYCKRCGYKMSSFHHGQADKDYYRHSPFKKNCGKLKFVRATELENSVLLFLVQTFGDPELIERAIKREMPDEGRKQLTEEKESLQEDLKKLKTKWDNLLSAVEDKLYTNEEVVERKNKILITKREKQIRINAIDNELGYNPDPKEIKKISKWAVKIMSTITKTRPQIIFKRSFEWKRKLVEKAFAGTNPDGTPLGVYLDKDPTSGVLTFEIRGLFETTIRTLPLSDDELLTMFHFDPDFQDIEETLKDIKIKLTKYGDRKM